MKTTFKLLIVLILFVSFAFSGTETLSKYFQIRIFVPDKATLDAIWNAGVDFESASGKIGGWMEFVVNQYEIKKLNGKNIQFEIVVSDLAKKTENELSLEKTPFSAQGFGYGSMGGYYTYDETNRQLDTMKLQYPSLITAKESVGVSVEGRIIWAVKISTNPGINSPNKSEVLFTALHHAREPEGLMAVMYYMWWLLQNYGTDAEATYLVNSRQNWFIPIVNPDGYVYNQTTNPGGGGFWRKNRRSFGAGIYGVDPNRNYGTYEMWNSLNLGSSTDSASDVFRGPAPFSEPENAAIDNFMRAHSIKACLNYHSYGNYLIYPWGFLSRESSDSLTYREFAYEMTGYSRFKSGTDMQTVNYSTRGNSDDYMFGDTTKPRTFAMTPEVGSSSESFWPPKNRIIPLAAQCLGQNKVLSYIAGQYSVLKKYDLRDSSGNEFLGRNKPFVFSFTIRNKGLVSASHLQFGVRANSSSIQFADSLIRVTLLPARSETQVKFLGRTALSAQLGKPIQTILSITDSNSYTHNDTLTIVLGTPTVLLDDSATDGTVNWTADSWDVSPTAHTPPYSFTDSPVGNYTATTDNMLALTNPINFFGYSHATLKFWTKWAIEPSYDYATIEATTNGGTTWTTLRSQLSRKGSGYNPIQLASSLGYDGYTPGLDWIEQEIDLNQFINKQIFLKFRMRSDPGYQNDGWYVDDIRVYAYTLDTTTVGVSTEKNLTTPKEFALHQNFPNPFNPVTVISYQLPVNSFVSLKVYNVLGQEVVTLVNEKKESGTFEVTWDASTVPSGVYLYRLNAASANGTKAVNLVNKMVVLK